MKRVFSFFILLFLPVSAWAFTLSNFDEPESMVCDLEDGAYYISNMHGSMTEKKGAGYISKINASGDIVIQRFIGGQPEQAFLNAPKGLVVAGQTLCVADIDTVKIFEKKTKKFLASVDLSSKGAKFLNDITADASGDLYVSDTMADKIFKVEPKKSYNVSVFKDSGELGGPNGLAFNPKSKNLMVVTWKTGQILEITRDGRIHVLKKNLSTLDGIDFDNEGNLYVSNYEKGEVYRIPHLGRGVLSTVLSGLTTPADISYDRKKEELLVPSTKSGKVSANDRKSLTAIKS